MTGKGIRSQRIRDPASGRYVIVPLDHGVSSGPLPGIERPLETISAVAEGGATSVVVHKGLMPLIAGTLPDIGTIVHLSASTSRGRDPNAKVIVGAVEDALRLGADAVSIHVNIGSDTEGDQLTDLGMVSSECLTWGLPLLAMVYPRGKDIPDPYDVDLVRHCARLGAELGADIVKTNYTGSPETFAEVVRSCPVPVVIAGGERMDSDLEVLRVVDGAMRAGAKGISIGRNIWQHPDPGRMSMAVAAMVTRGASVEEALAILKRE